ncbi:MAG TPA: hypothetical protein P5121_28355, partial [Caldilineaceae bacterium]|nr:hypothetical protein [Caldilineaceae bacterium]
HREKRYLFLSRYLRPTVLEQSLFAIEQILNCNAIAAYSQSSCKKYVAAMCGYGMFFESQSISLPHDRYPKAQ